MAHFIVEYSANLRDELDVPGLLKALHGTACETGVFPLGGIRFRAVCCEDYLIADGDPENAFVHVMIRMGHGRALDVRRSVAEQVFATLCDYLKDIFDNRPLGISLEMTEIEPDLSFKQNNIHDRLKRKQGSPGT